MGAFEDMGQHVVENCEEDRLKLRQIRSGEVRLGKEKKRFGSGLELDKS